MINTRELVDVIEPMLRNYRAVAQESIREGECKVYVGAGDMDEFTLEDLAGHPEKLHATNNSEPCYASLESANFGRNEDGTEHGGYMIIDVLGRQVVDLINRDRTTRIGQSVKKSQVWHLSGHVMGLGFGPQEDVRGLKRAMGSYVIVDDKMWTYSDVKCRCPCLDADVFPSENMAQFKLSGLGRSERGYRVEQVTDNFLQRYVAAHGGDK